MSHEYQLVPVTEVHRDFLFSLFEKTFGMPLLSAGLPEALAEQLVRQQFDVKEAAYRNDFPEAQHCIIEIEGDAVGQLRMFRGERDARIVDISILPDWQRKGLGSAVLKDMLRAAQHEHRALKLSVERNSAALHLYRKLGFQTVHEDELYCEMVNAPGV